MRAGNRRDRLALMQAARAASTDTVDPVRRRRTPARGSRTGRSAGQANPTSVDLEVDFGGDDIVADGRAAPGVRRRAGPGARRDRRGGVRRRDRVRHRPARRARVHRRAHRALRRAGPGRGAVDDPDPPRRPGAAEAVHQRRGHRRRHRWSPPARRSTSPWIRRSSRARPTPADQPVPDSPFRGARERGTRPSVAGNAGRLSLRMPRRGPSWSRAAVHPLVALTCPPCSSSSAAWLVAEPASARRPLARHRAGGQAARASSPRLLSPSVQPVTHDDRPGSAARPLPRWSQPGRASRGTGGPARRGRSPDPRSAGGAVAAPVLAPVVSGSHPGRQACPRRGRARDPGRRHRLGAVAPVDRAPSPRSSHRWSSTVGVVAPIPVPTSPDPVRPPGAAPDEAAPVRPGRDHRPRDHHGSGSPAPSGLFDRGDELGSTTAPSSRDLAARRTAATDRTGSGRARRHPWRRGARVRDPAARPTAAPDRLSARYRTRSRRPASRGGGSACSEPAGPRPFRSPPRASRLAAGHTPARIGEPSPIFMSRSRRR